MAFTTFSANTVIRSAEVNENFNLKADKASPTFTGTLTASIITATTIIGTTITGTTIVGTSITSSSMNTDTLTASSIVGTTITGTTIVGTSLTVSNQINLTGGKIAFPSSQSASANANTLDDYEEGTFTPTISGTGTAGVGTYGTRLGTYTKTGRVVVCHWYTNISSHTGTGNIALSGLPFTSEASSIAACAVYHSNMGLTAGYTAQAQVTNGQTTINLEQVSTGGGATAAVALDTSFVLSMTITYTT